MLVEATETSGTTNNENRAKFCVRGFNKHTCNFPSNFFVCVFREMKGHLWNFRAAQGKHGTFKNY